MTDTLLHKRTILITGGTGGIGKQTALALARLGATVIITGRNLASAQTAAEEIRQASGNPQVDVLAADLSTRSGVKAIASQYRAKYQQLDVLINNAGLAEAQRRLTQDGVEADFAVNVVAPFLLTQELMPCLQASPAARVITVTGGSHSANSPIDTGNLQAEREFVGLNHYSHTKLAMMAVMYEFAQRVAGSSMTSNVCYPGQASTAMTRSVTPDMLPGVARLIWPLFKWFVRPDGGKSAAKAAQSSVFLASSPAVESVNGQYFYTRCQPTEWPKAVVDPAIRQHVWATVEDLTRSGR
jgi:NAD(P)-dependent dehydrogenase (short-subunit alcohol dehydrogenase family)